VAGAVDAAIEAGASLFDTAEAYDFPQVQTLIKPNP
jgi:aryl-alcohol dehydrogenase-like predicted oxidoreductase